MNSVMPIELNSLQQQLTSQVRDLAQSKFAPRAAEYDRTTAFPEEDFRDLFQSGLLSAAVPLNMVVWAWAPPRKCADALAGHKGDRQS